MTTLTIEIPDKVEKTISELVIQLGGKVIVLTVNQESSFGEAKKQVLNNLESSVTFVKLHKEGKVQTATISELLNEL